MKAIGFKTSQPIDAEDSLFEFDAPMATIERENDIVVKVSAASVNPVDSKVRTRFAVDQELDDPIIPGYDAVGTVIELGSSVKNFQVGDRVYYAGDFTRQGSNAEYHTVDARIVAKAPTSLIDIEAAALPLTTLTGWEALFDRMNIDPSAEGKTLLIIGGTGGVGSITIQIAKQLTKLNVIATASRPESAAWVKKMGADHVANHHNLIDSVRELGFETVDYILNLADTVGHWDATVELIATQGTICSIVDFEGSVELGKLMFKCVTFAWELMFTRPMYNTEDISRQHEILESMACLIDEGRITSILQTTISGFNAENHKQAHRLIESGRTIGKIAIDYP